MIAINKKAKTLISVFFYAIPIIALLLWFGVFSSDTIVEKRVALILVISVYIAIPIILKRYERWNLLLEDKRNIYLLAISGLFAVFAVHETIDKGLLSVEFVFSTSLAVCIFIYTLFIVKSESEKNTNFKVN